MTLKEQIERAIRDASTWHAMSCSTGGVHLDIDSSDLRKRISELPGFAPVAPVDWPTRKHEVWMDVDTARKYIVTGDEDDCGDMILSNDRGELIHKTRDGLCARDGQGVHRFYLFGHRFIPLTLIAPPLVIPPVAETERTERTTQEAWAVVGKFDRRIVIVLDSKAQAESRLRSMSAPVCYGIVRIPPLPLAKEKP